MIEQNPLGRQKELIQGRGNNIKKKDVEGRTHKVYLGSCYLKNTIHIGESWAIRVEE